MMTCIKLYRVLRFSYRKLNGEFTQREVEPHYVWLTKKGNLITICWDFQRDDWRAFDLNRIRDVDVSYYGDWKELGEFMAMAEKAQAKGIKLPINTRDVYSPRGPWSETMTNQRLHHRLVKKAMHIGSVLKDQMEYLDGLMGKLSTIWYNQKIAEYINDGVFGNKLIAYKENVVTLANWWITPQGEGIKINNKKAHHYWLIQNLQYFYTAGEVKKLKRELLEDESGDDLAYDGIANETFDIALSKDWIRFSQNPDEWDIQSKRLDNQTLGRIQDFILQQLHISGGSEKIFWSDRVNDVLSMNLSLTELLSSNDIKDLRSNSRAGIAQGGQVGDRVGWEDCNEVVGVDSSNEFLTSGRFVLAGNLSAIPELMLVPYNEFICYREYVEKEKATPAFTRVKQFVAEPFDAILFNDTLVGAVSYELIDGVLRLGVIDIIPAYQKQGIGKKVINYLFKATGAEYLMGESTDEARPFWKALGAEFDKNEDPDYFPTFVIYSDKKITKKVNAGTSSYDDAVKEAVEWLRLLEQEKEEALEQVKINPNADPDYYAGPKFSDTWGPQWGESSQQEKFDIIEGAYYEEMEEANKAIDKAEKDWDEYIEATRERTLEELEQERNEPINLSKTIVEQVLNKLGLEFKRRESNSMGSMGESSYWYVGGIKEKLIIPALGDYGKEHYEYEGEGFVIRVSDHEPSDMYEGLHEDPDLSYVAGYDDDFKAVVFWGRRFSQTTSLDEFSAKLEEDINQLQQSEEAEESLDKKAVIRYILGATTTKYLQSKQLVSETKELKIDYTGKEYKLHPQFEQVDEFFDTNDPGFCPIIYNNQIVGGYDAEATGDRILLHGIFIVPAMRGKGIAKQVVEALFDKYQRPMLEGDSISMSKPFWAGLGAKFVKGSIFHLFKKDLVKTASWLGKLEEWYGPAVVQIYLGMSEEEKENYIKRVKKDKPWRNWMELGKSPMYDHSVLYAGGKEK